MTTNTWKEFGDLGEKTVAKWLNGQDSIIWAIPHAMTNLKDKRGFQQKFGDIIVYKKGGGISAVEVKTDDLCQYTNNVGFEVWARYNPDSLSHAREVGWWHKNKTFFFSSLVFVMVNQKSIFIKDAMECKRWCHDNIELFETKSTTRQTRAAEGKRSLSIYIERDVFIEKCPYAQEVEIDTTTINNYCNEDVKLKNRRKRFAAMT